MKFGESRYSALSGQPQAWKLLRTLQIFLPSSLFMDEST